ncbi:Endo-1,3(4)-beta-glucanase [Pseudocercospora fuligena]|uniref:endo-1,3(4)-beta-glucanase n=1 Tax=Pseudocercospora fuligena TaxID=685502 RepID=A0A8H6VKM3_9PEZI|nr:Endo-1,3(4)-beta-glucanase [Pseudocercospora fuligena]
MHLTTVITGLALFSTAGWAGYVLQDDYFSGGSFFDKFDFFADEDPTHGFVTYKNYDACIEEDLLRNTSTNIVMKVDDTNVTPNGRPSVRISSKNSYNTALIVLDLDHMPGSICGLWPAFWTLGPNWPNNGEIDIIEGVSCSTSNAMTLHTGPGCSLDSSTSSNKAFTGAMKNANCVSGGDDNTGCQIATSNTNTYGAGLNAINGGIYAMEWTTDFISIWFFPRGSYPDDVLGSNPDPSGWGLPLSNFRLSCDIAKSFQDHSIVFDTTFCGDWAGNAWSGDAQCSGLADTCNSYVENNPNAFSEAYWSVNALKVYQQEGGSSPSSEPYGSPTSTPASVSQPVSSYEPESSSWEPVTSAPPYITSSPPAAGPTDSAGGPESYGPPSVSPWGPGGYTPIVGPGGSVGESQPPASTSWGGWWSNPDGSAGYNGGGGWNHRHARHLRQHKRHHGNGL